MTHEINMPVPATRPRTTIGTGAARRIGAALAKRLARDGLAAAVTAADRARTVAAVTASGGSTSAVGVEALARLR